MKELESLIYENEKLIYSIIGKYTAYFDKDDLYQVAIMGLINAYKNYQNDKDTKFSSYAYFYIKGEVKKFLRDSNVVKVSKDLIKLNETIEKAENFLIQKNKREPSLTELSLFLEIDKDKIIEAKNAKIYALSLDDTEVTEESLYNKVEVIESSYDSDILDLRLELDKLSDIDKALINERYLYDKSQMETSRSLNMTQSMVSRKEKEILTRLRTRLM